jgi:gamma-glutamyltranspeptidase
VDAALAALFCNGVYNCQSMGLGGGFLMTVYTTKVRVKGTVCITVRAWAWAWAFS